MSVVNLSLSLVRYVQCNCSCDVLLMVPRLSLLSVLRSDPMLCRVLPLQRHPNLFSPFLFSVSTYFFFFVIFQNLYMVSFVFFHFFFSLALKRRTSYNRFHVFQYRAVVIFEVAVFLGCVHVSLAKYVVSFHFHLGIMGILCLHLYVFFCLLVSSFWFSLYNIIDSGLLS